MNACCWYSEKTKGKWHSLFCSNGPNVCGYGAPLGPGHYHSFKCSANNVILAMVAAKKLPFLY